MKNFYSIFALLFIVCSAFAQNVNNNFKMAQKKSIDNNLPKAIKYALEQRSAAVDCENEFYCENFESITIPALPSGMSTTTSESNYFIPLGGSSVEVDGFKLRHQFIIQFAIPISKVIT